MAINRMEIGVVGVTFEGRQGVLASLYQEQEQNVPIAGMLQRKPDNRYDANAIRVLVATPTQGQHVGYVPRDLAAKLAPRLDAGEVAQVTGVRIIRGDHDHRVTYGARIDAQFESSEKEAVTCQQPQPRLL